MIYARQRKVNIFLYYILNRFNASLYNTNLKLGRNKPQRTHFMPQSTLKQTIPNAKFAMLRILNISNHLLPTKVPHSTWQRRLLGRLTTTQALLSTMLKLWQLTAVWSQHVLKGVEIIQIIPSCLYYPICFIALFIYN